MCLKFFKVKSCCCCFSLKTGTILIGYIALVYSILGIALWSTFVELLINSDDEEGNESSHNVTDPASSDSEESEEFQELVEYELRIAILLINCVLSVLLIFGVCKDKPYLLKIYLIGALVDICANTATVIAAAFIENITITAVQLLLLSMHLYFLLIVWNCYLELKELTEPPPYDEELGYLRKPPKPEELN